MFDHTYRDKATASMVQREPLDDLLQVSSPRERLFVAGIGVTVLAFVCWLGFGSVSRTVYAEGILIEAGPRHPVVAPIDGRLEIYLVSVGDYVEAGDPVARQSVSELDRRAAMLRDLADSVEAAMGEAHGNGLASFESSVREALLRIQAERVAKGVIVGGIAGVVMTLARSPGDALEAGEEVAWVRSESGLPPRVVAQVSESAARQIRPGMPATVEAALPHGPPMQFGALAVETPARSMPDWLASGIPSSPVGALRRVDFLVDSEDARGIADGTPVNVRIALKQHSPAAVLLRPRP